MVYTFKAVWLKRKKKVVCVDSFQKKCENLKSESIVRIMFGNMPMGSLFIPEDPIRFE